MSKIWDNLYFFKKKEDILKERRGKKIFVKMIEVDKCLWLHKISPFFRLQKLGKGGSINALYSIPMTGTGHHSVTL